ncbi:MAG: 4Fe-4S binding protein [Bacteroidales bacterium]|nr:4Fe-4S binding protein [Bacteroidales bacterium]MCL2738303.1 4Fe-4S binding protein [Bacteroidales bacterium]
MRIYQWLKWSRVALSLLILIGISWYFTGVRVQWTQGLSLLLKAQFVPAFLSSLGASLLALASILLLTVLLGRIYCSLLCPLGVFQDVVIRISHLFKTKKQRLFRYTKDPKWLRYSILSLTIIAWIVGFTLPLLLLDPYGNYGRMASHLFKPVVYTVHNGLHHIWPDTIYYQSYIAGSILGWLLPVAIFVTVVGMSAFRGRLFCNSLCPVGSFLGIISKYAAFRPVVDKSACNHCGLCGMKCKAECINSKEQQIDYSRCVACFNCTLACQPEAVRFVFSWKKQPPQEPASIPVKNNTRRAFIAAAGSMAGVAAVYRAAGGRLLTGSSSPDTIAPPGARSHAHLKQFCTSCQACVAACPTRIIQPTIKGYGLDGWMLPAINFQNGFCTYSCNRCSQVCPTSALERVSLEEKKIIRIGKARLTFRNCVVNTDRTDCGACDEHCPTKAVRMVPWGDTGLRRPQVDVEYCIGCGGCEFICPTTPKAIVVQAQSVHDTALPPPIEKQQRIQVDDFGF